MHGMKKSLSLKKLKPYETWGVIILLCQYLDPLSTVCSYHDAIIDNVKLKSAVSEYLDQNQSLKHLFQIVIKYL